MYSFPGFNHRGSVSMTTYTAAGVTLTAIRKARTDEISTTVTPRTANIESGGTIFGWQLFVRGYTAPKTEAEISTGAMELCKALFPEKEGWEKHHANVAPFDPDAFAKQVKESQNSA